LEPEISGLKGFAGASTYVATKFAVIGFSRSLDIELGPLGIKVTAICPAGVDTDWAIGTGLTEKTSSMSTDSVPKRRR
jgi:NAD(P)-dependent dehydrogenase (short-subunit alcohol dehydrogenase family)